MSTEKHTAAETYTNRAQDIAAMLDWLTDELEVHAERAKAEPANWGFAGELGHVRQKVKEILAFLSASSEEQIEEALADLRM
jgi:hypothetical protein